ncbi:MAG: hypothetical protein K5773_07990 [Pseudobutyrivibrio sp.]|nr:hypothetical protein [Pseudobutyrivibrio sp.]
MEKQEYIGKFEEMNEYLAHKKFADAVAVANSINWRKLHNINDIVHGSEVYEAAGRLEEARDLLYIAHERSPIGRMILYKLCNISVKLKDLDSAQEYYNDFVQIAPHDSLKYILKYNINVAKGADNATLIKILEQLKENDFIEEWAYELAYLYHKTNQADKCIELCDEIILWFGDGPVVERALELKMLYQPLDKNQENKYRHMQQKKDGITEIVAGEELKSGEIIPQTISIPSVELPTGPERFNTISLQAEIKKSIDEIMKATETEEVSENMDAIKDLVEEIPYLKVPEEEKTEVKEEKFSVNDSFQQYLEEGFDGQISLMLPDDESSEDEQVEGQMTIDDVLAEWEKTKRAAEAAMEEAKSKELEAARTKALREANSVLNRLEGVMSKLDAGMTSHELLKEQYLSAKEDEAQEESEELIEGGFSIPKLNVDGALEGSVNIPVVKTAGAIAAAAATGAALAEGTSSWKPPILNPGEETDNVDFKEASQMIADVNRMLQKEIDRLTDETNSEAGEEEIPQVEPEISSINIVSDVESPEEPLLEVEQESGIEVSDVISFKEVEEDSAEEEADDFLQDEFSDQGFDEKYTDDNMVYEYDENEPIGEEEFEEINQDFNLDDEGFIDDDLPTIPLPEDLFEDTKEFVPVPEKVSLDEETVQAPANNGIEVDEDELLVFSYFLPISGMKANIIDTIKKTGESILEGDTKSGNIVIVGEPGSGKTQLATGLIKVIKSSSGCLNGGIGKISGSKLNEKDIQKLYSKVQGGCLIIESAGDISKETALTLSLLMENDTTGTLIILEDNKRGIDKALSKDHSFGTRFTERIHIPVFTIDELVTFAKTYAMEAGCSIEDMGILALYNRINLIGRYDHVTTIKEVAEIMDEAIDKASRGGFFSKPKYDRDGNVVLKEKDFQ